MASNTPYIYNRRAAHEYHILEKFELGIVLKGTEVKSVRNGKMDISEAYVTVNNNELFLVNSYIDEYTYGNLNNHSLRAQRKLLAHKAEIKKMREAYEVDGNTLIPLVAYFKKGKLKIEVAICKGKEKKDKRQDKMKKEANREIERAIKEKNK